MRVKKKLRKIQLRDVLGERSEATYDCSFEHFARLVREGKV